MIVAEIIYNLSILAVLLVLSNFLDDHFDRRSLTGQVLQGLLFGSIVVVAMSYPFQYAEGIFFDGRTIVVSIGTVFFGPVTGSLAMLTAVIYQVWMGGQGVMMGILTITFAFIIGWVFYRLKSKNPAGQASTWQLFYMGVIVHFMMVVFVYALPSDYVQNVLQTVALTLITVYPVLTVLIGKIFTEHEDRRMHMEKLEESDERFRQLISSSEDIIFTVNRDLELSGVFGKWMEPLGRTADDYVGKTAVDIHGEEIGSYQEEQFRKAFAGEDVVYDWQDDIGRGPEHYQTNISPIRREDGEIIGLVGIARNITGIRKMEAQLKRSLKEKNILITEIHHRVKNNMAIISSLLNLQSGYAQGEETRTLLLETQNRVRAMSLVHELVYEGDNFIEMDMRDMLQRLVNLLARSLEAPGHTISASVEADDITLDMSSSIPLALLVNELITNAWKHGFNGKSNGVIKVRFVRSEGKFVLSIADNGRGISSEQLERLEHPKSFGYTIIQGLVQQLNGTIHYDNSGEGLKVLIRF